MIILHFKPWTFVGVFFLNCLLVTSLNYYLSSPQQEITLQTIACPPSPKNVLEANHLKPISVTAFYTKISDNITSDYDLGYIFTANAGQKLKYNKLDDICVWVYTPNNQLMNNSTFPLNGKYIMQVATLKKLVNFDIYVSLEVDPNIKQEMYQNIAKLQFLQKTSIPSPQTDFSTSTFTSSNKTIFEQLVSDHFENLKNQYYNIAFSQLSSNFQEVVKNAELYGSIWKKFTNLQLAKLEIISASKNKADLNIEIEYSLEDSDPQLSKAKGEVELLFDSTSYSWLIDGIKLNSN